MNFSILTLFPDLYKPFLRTSLVNKAQISGRINFNLKNLFEMCKTTERVDSPSFGHDAGMLIKPTVIEKGIEDIEREFGNSYKIFFSPHGKKLNQSLLKKIKQETTKTNHIMLLPARYEGMDARVEEYYADAVVSIGDYVLMGGDLPAMVFLESFLRLFDGIIQSKESVEKDSFSGPFLDHPNYCEPVNWKNMIVPEVLRSGDHKKIMLWQKQEAIKRTIATNFEWLKSNLVDDKKSKEEVFKNIPNHYAILMHTQILLPNDIEGTSSVTSLDIHDIARSSKTYGIKKYFIVTPLKDQQAIVNTLLEFWNTDIGINYNPHRHQALEDVILVSEFNEAINIIKSLENSDPIIAATTAKSLNMPILQYNKQSEIWALKKPFVFLFGTARGLAPSILQACDYLMEPLYGLSNFNHLSVRSAAAIVFDRWLGINPANNDH